MAFKTLFRSIVEPLNANRALSLYVLLSVVYISLFLTNPHNALSIVPTDKSVSLPICTLRLLIIQIVLSKLYLANKNEYTFISGAESSL